MAFNWKDAIQGSLAGAGSGATLGSSVPGIGTAAGGIGGGILGALMSLLSGSNDQSDIQQIQNVSPEVQSILQFLLQQGQQGLQNPYGGFEDIANQATNQFNQQTVPSLAQQISLLLWGKLVQDYNKI
jgi:phage tail tape-measure protein